MQNLNLFFNKSYFDGLGLMDGETFAGELKDRNESIYDSVFHEEPYPEGDYRPMDEALAPQHFRMQTGYPGLLVGTGYAHEIQQGADDCIKLGFSFDYVTGQPYIPGSSVKGMLRSVFRQTEVIKEVLGSMFPNLAEALGNDEAIRELTASIFDGQDIFFDAVPCKGDAGGHLVGSDYITPHGTDITKNPVPLLMLRILPQVIFEFRFRLQDSKTPSLTLSADDKMKLFIRLLEIFGIGAKTNVGYGTLQLVREPRKTVKKEQAEHCVGNGGKCKNPRLPGGFLCESCRNAALKNAKCAVCKKPLSGKAKGRDVFCPVHARQYQI